MRRKYFYSKKQGKVVELTAETSGEYEKLGGYRKNVRPVMMKPFVTDNITGKPVEITSKRQHKRLMKENRVVEYSPDRSAKNRLPLRKSRDRVSVRQDKDNFQFVEVDDGRKTIT